MVRWTALMVLVFAVGCGKKSPADKVTYVADDDARMNAAIANARSSVDTFASALRSPRPGQTGFSVKMAFKEGKYTEHIWLSGVTFDGKRFSGSVDNEPEKVSNVEPGDKASVEASQISDWMYIENGKLVGGYTLRAMRDGLPPAERAQMDKDLPFTVD